MSDKKYLSEETELSRLRRRVKELEAALAITSGNANTAEQQQSLPDLATDNPEGLSGFLHSAVEQKNILESVLQSIDDGVIVANSKGEMVLFNRAARRLVGIGPVAGSENWAPRYGCYRADGVTPYRSEELPLTRALRGETVRNEEVFVCNKDIPDGTLVIATANPIRDPHGTLAGGIVIFRDITDQKLAQQTLEASEERFRAFMENLPAIAFIKDAAGRYVYGNRHFFEYHPTTPQELERAVKTDFELTAAESASALQANDRKVLAGSTPLHIDEQLINFQGQPTWFSVYKFRLTSVSGEHLVGGIAVDVTERRRDEQQLIADEQLLRKLIDLQERERTLVAHDIHDGFVQDVVGAKMISETIANRLDSKKDEKSKGQFVAIDDALGRAIAEARRLISELRPMVIDEEGIVEAIRYLISDSQYSKEMEITFIEKMGGMRLDPMLEGNLFRIVQEALNNALRHSDAATVSIHLNRDEEELTLTVTDNGIGFHPEAADANRFGLRGIRERARLFDGTATINSAPGQGTRIKVKMPLLVPKDPPPKA